MTRPNTTRSKLLQLAEPVVTGAGYELIDLEYRREQVGWVVRVYIDRPGRPGAAPASTAGCRLSDQGVDAVGINDCERVSRELAPVLDVSDPVPAAYSLEVSSPGLDRPLRTAEHFRERVGAVASVALVEPSNGRRNFKGTIVAVSADGAQQGAPVVVLDVDGTEYSLPVADVDTARLVPDWGELLSSSPPGRGRAKAKPRTPSSLQPSRVNGTAVAPAASAPAPATHESDKGKSS